MAEIKEAPKPKTGTVRDRPRTSRPARRPRPMMSSGSPFAFMRRFAEEMDHLFEDFGLESGWHMPSFAQPRPRAAAPRGRPRPRRVVAAGRRPGARGTVRGPRRPAGAEQGGRQGGGHRRHDHDPGRAEAGEEGGARGILLQRVQLRQLLPRHPASRGRRGFEGDRGVPQGRPRGHRAGAHAHRSRRPDGWRSGRRSSALDPSGAGGMRPARAMPPGRDRHDRSRSGDGP